MHIMHAERNIFMYMVICVHFVKKKLNDKINSLGQIGFQLLKAVGRFTIFWHAV
jgi:hypothetical protein